MRPCTKRSHANWPIARTNAKLRSREYHHSFSHIFEIRNCSSSFQPHGIKHSRSQYRHHDKTAYLLSLIIKNKGSVFVSQVLHEVAEILGMYLKHATTKLAQTIGVLEGAHATIKTSLKMASVEYKVQWHKCLPIATLTYNTTYASSTDFEPHRVFRGSFPHNILDHNLGLRFNPNIAPTTDFADDLLRRNRILYNKTKNNVMHSFIKYKKYYDKKARASPLKGEFYCLTHQPKADHHGSKIPFRDFRWIGF